MNAIETKYDQTFYDSQMAESLQAARIYLAHVWELVRPAAVLDVGCGRGTWLKAAGELGCANLMGVDGAWNRQELMVDPSIRFQGADLNQPLTLPKADLALSLEVAEHLEPASARGFARSLTAAADVVLFGAACPQQGGTHHINEQPASYWAAHFEAAGYAPFDLFRPRFWSDERVPFWYRQNTFLYVRRNSAAFRRLREAGHAAIDAAFMDCVHPELYAQKLHALQPRPRSFKTNLRDLLPSLGRALARRRKGVESSLDQRLHPNHFWPGLAHKADTELKTH